MDEILKAIQSGNSDLNVPPLSYPALSGSSGQAATAAGDLQRLESRMRCISSVTQTAQLLIKEAQAERARGNVADAEALTAHANSLRQLVAYLADQPTRPISVPPATTVR